MDKVELDNLNAQVYGTVVVMGTVGMFLFFLYYGMRLN